MQYVVSVDHKGLAMRLTRSDCERLYEVLYIQCSGLMLVYWGIALKRMGMLGVVDLWIL